MKNLLLILLFIISILSCNSKKDKPNNIKDIQEMFKIKGNVKEIQKKIVSEDFYFYSITSFDSDGNPIETIDYDKKGKIKSREPWIRATEEELKRKKLKNEYDSKHRLIKQTEYNNGELSFETEYKYNKTSKKVEEIRKVDDRTIQSLYDTNGLLKERKNYISIDYDSFWQSKERFIYNKNHNLVATLVYQYSDEKHIVGKYLFQYDKIGSIVKTTTYYRDGKIEIENRKIIYY